MPWAEVICQVWFWYKRSRNHVYYHENNWRLVGHQVRIDNPTALLDPYDLEDLIAWKIDYDLLPIDLQNLLQTVAKETFSLISADNPDGYGLPSKFKFLTFNGPLTNTGTERMPLFGLPINTPL